MLVILYGGHFIAFGYRLADSARGQIFNRRFPYLERALGKLPVYAALGIAKIQGITEVSRHLYKVSGLSACASEAMKSAVLQIY